MSMEDSKDNQRKRDSSKDGIARKYIEDLIFGSVAARRFTQDSPILPDVWIEYAKDPTKSLDLLCTPHIECSAGQVCQYLNGVFGRQHHGNGKNHHLAYNQSAVVGSFELRDLVAFIMPLSDWWSQSVLDPLSFYIEPYRRFLKNVSEPVDHPGDSLVRSETSVQGKPIWLLNLLHTILLGEFVSQDLEPTNDLLLEHWEEFRTFIFSVSEVTNRIDPDDHEPKIFSVSLNRAASASISRSIATVKADAAGRLFKTSSADLIWAVVDSGIDARHPAFR